MVQPMETTILQWVRNVLFHLGWEISDVCIGEPGIVELADVETELGSHGLETRTPQLHVRVSDVHLIAAAIAEKEIVNRQMPDTNPSIGRFISIHEIGFHFRQLCNCLVAQCAIARCCEKHSNHQMKLGVIVHYLGLEDTGVKFVERF